MSKARASTAASTARDEARDGGLVTTVDGTATVTPRELRRRATAWALWDVGNSAFQAIVITFVFATYLASDLFLDPAVAALGAADPQHPDYLAAQAASTGTIAAAITVSGFVVAVFAPAFGVRTDGAGRRKRWLAVYSGATILCMFLMFAITPDEPLLLWGAVLLAVGTVFSELAGVSYNAMLSQVSTRKTVGRVSGIGWGLGYIGSIVLLLLVLLLFIQSFGREGTAGLLAVPSGQEGAALNIRLVIVASAIWYLGFSLPVLVRVPEIPADPARRRIGFLQSYVELFRTVARVRRRSPRILLFLLSSAIFRDGLAGIFSFGAILAAQVYGFDDGEVIYFAVAANLAAGAGTIAAGWLDDRLGPKAVMVGSLLALIACCAGILLLGNTAVTFWVLGLFLCLFVGPVQAASRSYLSRVTPPGHEGELFGLYATTNRVASFLAPGLFTLFVTLTGQTKLGVIGLGLVLALGLVLLLPVRAREARITLKPS